MSNCYNTHDNGLFPSTNVLVDIVLQKGTKYFSYPSPFYHNKQKYAKYEIIISCFVIFEKFYRFFNKNDIPMLYLRKEVIF